MKGGISMENTLYYGDNLDILRKHIHDDSVDLIYLDPPFNSKANYNILYKEISGEFSDAQITAFEDTWHWGDNAEATFTEIIDTAPANAVKMITAFRSFIGNNDMMAYLTMMCMRLIELRRVLKDTGSIYLHCDPTASHYLKILMDAIFGVKHFQNEIIWCYDTGGRSTRLFPRKHDIILWYSNSNNYLFNYDEVSIPRDVTTMHEPVLKDEKGRPYQRNIKYGKEYRYYLDKGVLPNDWWVDIQALNPAAKERLGYPTQKPEHLLERIIKASSKEGDIILDPFCGCGTTVTTAQKLNRNWIGIDITHLAINIIKLRLKSMFGIEPKKDYKVIGEPEDLTSAIALANQNRYQFQWWATSLIDAKPYGDKKKGKDTGIDGFIFFMDKGHETKKCIVSVKSGKVQPTDVRDLIGVLSRENAGIGVFITLHEPTRDMIKDAVSAGYYRSQLSGKDYPKIQILTIEELLKGIKPKIPNQISPFKKATPSEGIQFDLVDTVE
jgi:site-specific DNA-methyltransferase (adenine-specific)